MTQRKSCGMVLALLGVSALAFIVGYVVWAAKITCTATPCTGTESGDQITISNIDTAVAITVNALGGSDRVFVSTSASNQAHIVNAGTGNDLIFGGAGADTLRGDAGNDQINGGAGVDIIGDTDASGGCSDADEPGNDRINAGAGAETVVCGGLGNDQINGGDDGDTLFGNAGNDRLFGDTGNDTMRDGPGNDTVEAGPGTDTFPADRGTGNDTFVFRRGDVGGAEALTCTFNAGERGRVVLIGYNQSDLPAGLQPGTVLTGATTVAITDPGTNQKLTITPGNGSCIITLRSR